MKLLIQRIILVSFLFFAPAVLLAQDVSVIKGRVIDDKNKPVAHATVKLGAKQETKTDSKGDFSSLSPIQLPLTIRVHAIGYLTNELVWGPRRGRDSVVIQMTVDPKHLDEVLVTGRRNNSYLINSTSLGGKFSGTLKDLPQSVSLVSRELMEDRQAFQLTDMIQDLAGVSQASAYDDLIIRGFSSGYTNGLRLLNGMRSGYGYGTSFWHAPQTANLESIEVLKGPGGSLFGDVVPGGTINMVTKKPLDEQKTNVNFGVGSFQTLRTTVDAGGPLDKEKILLYRFNFAYERSSTFRDNNKRKDILLAPSLTFRPSDKTQLDVDFTYDNFNGFLDRGIGIRNNDLYAQKRGFNVNQPTDFYKANFLTFSARFFQELSPDFTLNVNYMKSIYGEQLNEFRTLNTFANPPENTIMNMRFLSKNITDYTDNVVSYLSYRIKKPGHEHRLVLGVDYAQYEGDSDNVQREARKRLLNGEEVPLRIDLENPHQEVIDIGSYVWLPQAEFPFLNPYKSMGFYLQDQMTIGKRLNVVLGLRHEYYRSSSADKAKSYETSQHAWLPRVGFTFHINEQMNYFASYSQGYVPVGADFIYNYEQYGVEKPFQPERSYQVETGLKTGFFNNQLQTELSLFYISREDMMMPTGDLGDTGFPIYRQSGQVISQGIELDFRGQITKELQLMANYSFNPTKVKSSSREIEVGMPLANAPKQMGGAWMKYVFSAAKLKGLGFGLGMNFMNSRRMENPMAVDDQGSMDWGFWPGYSVWNSALYYHLKGARITLNYNNMFDTYYYLGGFDYTRGFIGTPRNLMLSIGFTF